MANNGKASNLNWVNVNTTDIACQKELAALGKARDAFKQAMVEQARKRNAIGKEETLVIAFKAWGISMAKVPMKGSVKASSGDAFAAL